MKKAMTLLMLLFLGLLPSAFAQQLTTGQRVLFIVVNAFVIGIVLWILQTFLMPGKAENEKKAATLIVFLGSAIIAFLYGSSGYIWQVGPLSLLFNRFVLGNAIIIGAAIYLLLGLLKVGNLNSPEGKGGYALLILLASVFLAVKIGPMWIWSNSIVSELINFLFYVDGSGYGGILNPFGPSYKLWIFITLFTVITFFFNNFLLKGKDAGKINYLLALLLSGHMAYNGIGPGMAIIIGEVIFILIFQESLKDSITNIYARWFVAAALVLWAGYAISSATGYPGISGTIFGLGGGPNLSGVGGAVGGVAYGIGWLIKAGFILFAGVLAYMGIKKLFPGGTP